MDSGDSPIRPTIRIEIQNDIVCPMDTGKSDMEDGEVSGEEMQEDDHNENVDSSKDTTDVPPNAGYKWWNKEGGFTTGIDIFSKDEQEKLSVRAERFGILSNESKAITEQQVQDLYDSLSITPGDEKLVRFDAVHMRGVEEMSTKDVFGYFSAYGPASIEWINDFSCNVVWLDNVSAARALYGLSKRINGLNEYLSEENPFVSENSGENKNELLKENKKGRSILLISKEESTNSAIDWESEEAVNISDISIPIPPGYWRYGKPHLKAKGILFRFTFKTDKKPLRAEKLSEYYKKYGNPNFGGLKGLISRTRKRQLKGNFSNREVRLGKPEEDSADSKNPWGSLAESWSNEDRGIEFNEPIEIVRTVSDQRMVITKAPGSKSIQERIGVKRNVSIENGADDEGGGEKRKKVPRMRMYADDEQERINRLKELKKMSQQKNPIEERTKTVQVQNLKDDLRNRLMQSDRKKLPDITVRLSQNSPEERKSTMTRFENRLGNKITRKNHEHSIRDRLSDKIYHYDDEQVIQDEYDEYDNEEPMNNRQKSTVKVVVRNTPKPTLASTISRGTSSFRSRESERSWRLSDREQFRSSRSYAESKPSTKDLRNKITDRKSSNSRVHRTHTINSVPLLRYVKKETSSESSETSESESQSSSDSSESSSSSSESDSSSEEEVDNSDKDVKHRSILKKTALSVSDKKLSIGKKDTLRIEVENDNYKKT